MFSAALLTLAAVAQSASAQIGGSGGPGSYPCDPRPVRPCVTSSSDTGTGDGCWAFLEEESLTWSNVEVVSKPPVKHADAVAQVLAAHQHPSTCGAFHKYLVRRRTSDEVLKPPLTKPKFGMTDQADLQGGEGWVDEVEAVEAHAQAAGVVHPAQGALHWPTLAAQSTAVGRAAPGQLGVMPRRRNSSRCGCEQ